MKKKLICILVIITIALTALYGCKPAEEAAEPEINHQPVIQAPSPETSITVEEDIIVPAHEPEPENETEEEAETAPPEISSEDLLKDHKESDRFSKGNPDDIPIPFGSNGNDTFPVCFKHGMLGIYDDIQEDLLQVKGITINFGQIRGKISINFYVAYLLLVRTKFQYCFYRLVYIHWLLFFGLFAGKGKEIFHYIRSALGFPVDGFNVFFHIIGEVFSVRQQV